WGHGSWDSGPGRRDPATREGARVSRAPVRRSRWLIRDAGTALRARLPAAVRAARVYGDRGGAERRADDRTGDGAAAGGRGSDPHGRRGRGPRERARLRGAQGAVAALSRAGRRAPWRLQGADRGR